MMKFPERQNIYYIQTFCGNEEAVGMTADNRYIYISYNDLRNNTELFEISHQEYLSYICAVQNQDEDALEKFRAAVFQEKDCIAYEKSHYEPNPVKFVQYGSEIWKVYSDFITRHTVTEAEFSGNTVILKTKRGESLSLNINQGGNFNGK